jgi:hypothetical protein
MPRFRITLPAFKRVEEIHEIEADSEDEAVDMALTNDPGEWVEDEDYYEVDKAGVRVERLPEGGITLSKVEPEDLGGIPFRNPFLDMGAGEGKTVTGSGLVPASEEVQQAAREAFIGPYTDEEGRTRATPLPPHDLTSRLTSVLADAGTSWEKALGDWVEANPRASAQEVYDMGVELARLQHPVGFSPETEAILADLPLEANEVPFFTPPEGWGKDATPENLELSMRGLGFDDDAIENVLLYLFSADSPFNEEE